MGPRREREMGGKNRVRERTQRTLQREKEREWVPHMAAAAAVAAGGDAIQLKLCLN